MIDDEEKDPASDFIEVRIRPWKAHEMIQLIVSETDQILSGDNPTSDKVKILCARANIGEITRILEDMKERRDNMENLFHDKKEHGWVV